VGASRASRWEEKGSAGERNGRRQHSALFEAGVAVRAVGRAGPVWAACHAAEVGEGPSWGQGGGARPRHAQAGTVAACAANVK
jgi:hypothetical protein